MSSEISSHSVGLKECRSSDLLIRRPCYLTNMCALKTTTQRLPSIEKLKKLNKTNDVNDRKKKRDAKSDEDDVQYWLKPGVSLPKLRVKNMEGNRTEKRETGDVFTTETTCWNKVFYDRHRFVDSNLSIICSRNGAEEVSVQEFPKSFEKKCFGPSKCQLLFKHYPTEEDTFEESRALKNWKFWLNRMRSTQDYLQQKTGKNISDLTINQLYNHREVLEEKELFTLYKKLEQEFQTRKTPYWVPHKSKKKVAETEEMKKMIVVEYIGQPFLIRKEKNLFVENAENTVKTRTCFFKEQKYRLKAHKPEIDRLAVIGEGASSRFPANRPSEYVDDIPKIYITQCLEEMEGATEDRKSIFWLVINNIEIQYEAGMDADWNSKVDHRYTWEIPFGSTQVGNLSEKIIHVENRGTIAVEYNWVLKKPVFKQSLNSFDITRYQPWFFFNKNSGVFLPGQKYELKFYNRANRSGVRIETWYLKTSPSLFPGDLGAKFTLTAVARSDYTEQSSNSVEQYLDERIKETTVKILLDRLIDEAMKPDFGLGAMEYRALLSDKNLFEYHNPKHYYHSQIVRELNETFSEVSCAEVQTEWDLSLRTLFSLVRNCTFEKHKKESLLKKLFNLEKMLLKPPYIIPREKNKTTKMIKQILCKMANLIEADYEYQQKCILHVWQVENDKCVKEPFEEKVSINLGLINELDSRSLLDEPNVKVSNFVRFYMMLYLKVHARLGEAIEAIVGVLETKKNLESWEAKK